MSSLAGAFNACSTLFTMDFYKQIRPGASQAQLVRVGRIATVVMIGIALLWIPVIQGARGLYEYLQGVQGYLAPPIAAGVLLRRLQQTHQRERLPRRPDGGIRPRGLPACRGHAREPRPRGYAGGYPSGSFLWIVNNIYFQYYSLLIFLVASAVLVGVSYATEAPDPAQIRDLTFATMSDDHRRESRASWSQIDVVNSGVVLALILAAYLGTSTGSRDRRDGGGRIPDWRGVRPFPANARRHIVWQRHTEHLGVVRRPAWRRDLEAHARSRTRAAPGRRRGPASTPAGPARRSRWSTSPPRRSPCCRPAAPCPTSNRACAHQTTPGRTRVHGSAPTHRASPSPSGRDRDWRRRCLAWRAPGTSAASRPLTASDHPPSARRGRSRTRRSPIGPDRPP